MELVINDDNLTVNDVEEFNTKVRAILIDGNNQILVANYGSVMLLPGGKVDEGETNLTAIIRELKEEIGQDYDGVELDFFTTLKYYQKNYPKRDGTFQNRLIQTHYFIGAYKEVKSEEQKLTEREQQSNFNLELVPLETIQSIVRNNVNANPRNIYFQKELLLVLDSLKNAKQDNGIKKLQKIIK